MVTPKERVRIGKIDLPHPVVAYAIRLNGEIGVAVALHVDDEEALRLRASMVDQMDRQGLDKVWRVSGR